MAKFYTYIIMTVVMTALLAMAGINNGFTIIANTGLLAGGFGISSWLVYGIIIVSLGLLAASSFGINIGGIQFSKTDLAVSAGLGVGTAVIFVADFLGVLTYSYGICPSGSDCFWVFNIIAIILGALGIGFAISLYDWVRGAYN